MRLISAKIENFRVHAGDEPVEVVFDEHLHVIHGPNESGKSTLMDAVAACLFQKYNLTGKAFDAMQPDDGSKPLVEVVFEDDGHEYSVSKHFKGQAGTCQLIVSQNARVESTLSGPDAEAKLNEALKLPVAGRGDRKDDQMAHWRLLWINQGHSNDEPTEHINPETREHLQGILNAETGSAPTNSRPSKRNWTKLGRRPRRSNKTRTSIWRTIEPSEKSKNNCQRSRPNSGSSRRKRKTPKYSNKR